MTDRKQEAIEILRDLGLWDCQIGYPPITKFYNRLLPLMRGEFPEEIIEALEEIESCSMLGERKMREYIVGLKFEDAPNVAVSAFTRIGSECRRIKVAKRLFEGDHIADEKVCQTCGGSGKIKDEKGKFCVCKPIPVVSPYEDEEDTCSRCDKHIDWCPQCDGTGECQHRERDWVDGKGICILCKTIILGKRIGKERRVKYKCWGIDRRTPSDRREQGDK